LTVYAVIGMTMIGLGNLWDVIAWSRGYASRGLWEPPSLTVPIKSAIGLARAVFELDFLFRFDWFYALAERTFPDKLLVEERFAATQLPAAAAFIATAALIAAGFAAAWFAIRGTGAYRRARSQRSGARQRSPNEIASLRLCVSYSGIIGLTTALWEPLNCEFWIAILPFLFLAGGHLIVAARPALPPLQPVAALFVTCLGVANFAGGILPNTDRKTDYWYMSNEALVKALRPGDLLITEGGYTADIYIAYYGGPQVTVLRTGSTPAAEIARKIDGRHARVLISSWAFSPPPALLRTKQFQHWDHAGLDRLYASYKPYLKPLVQSEAQTVWVLECPKSAEGACAAPGRH
jgi:hypothetical protein